MTTTTPPASVQVLGDAGLFRHITAFQLGLDMALLAFWRAHRGENAPLRIAYDYDNYALVELLVEHGSLRLLRMAERVQLRASSSLSFRSRLQTRNCGLHIGHFAYLALKHNRADVVEWALASEVSTIHDPLQAWGDAIVRAGEDGDLRILEILRQHAPLPTTNQINDIGKRISADMKHASVLRFIVDGLPAMPATVAMVTVAAAHCDRPLLEQLHVRGVAAPREPPGGRVHQDFGILTSRGPVRFDAALAARDLDVLEFLLQHYHQHLDSCDVAELASHTDPEIHRLALRFIGNLQRACVDQIHGCREHRGAVRLWVTTGILSPPWPISIDMVASFGMLDVVQLLHEHGIATATTDAMDLAAENARWDVVEFLHFNRSEGCTTRAMDAAIQQANLKYTLFLRDHRTEGCSPEAAEKAAANKQSTATLRFLHEHTEISFTPAVMDAAAACGNLAAVRFLHESRSEGCTKAAMDKAASNGHLRVVQYLHAHRSEGCTFHALRGVMQSRRMYMVGFLFENYRHLFNHTAFNRDLVTNTALNVVQSRRGREAVELLFNHFPHLFEPVLLHYLLVYGMFDMYRALRSRFPEGVVYRDMTESMIIGLALHRAGSEFELSTIRYIIDVLGRRDLAHHAMDGAAGLMNCSMHWVRAVYAVTGPESCRLSAVQAAIQATVGKHITLDRVKFLIRHCCEPNALEEAIKAIPRHADAAIATELRNWDPTADEDDELQPLHPFLLDPRASSWAIRELFNCVFRQFSPAGCTWAAVAACEHDVTMLEVIRDAPVVVDHTHASHGGTLDAEAVAQVMRYDDAPTRAIYAGNLEALQWMLSHVAGPVDPTLLGEALYYDSREIAEWLVAHHPEACVRVQWEPTRRELFPAYHVSEDVAHWLEHTPAVRNALDFGGLARYLVQQDDVESLRRLHTLDPDRVVANTELLALAKQLSSAKVVGFLSEIVSAADA